MNGTPVIAAVSTNTAPVHINVGGIIHSTTLQTLTRFPQSKIGKLFSGTLPITVDPIQSQYFIDRDGKMFRHILNYLRNGELLLGENFDEIALLLKEAEYFELEDLIVEVIQRMVKIYERSDNIIDSETEEITESDNSLDIDKDICNKKTKKKRNKKSKQEKLDLKEQYHTSVDDLALKQTTGKEEHSVGVTVDKYDKIPVPPQINTTLAKNKVTSDADVLYALTDSTGHVLEVWSSDCDIRSKIGLPGNPNCPSSLFLPKFMQTSVALKLRTKHCNTCSGIFSGTASYCFTCEKILRTCSWYQKNEISFISTETMWFPPIAKSLLLNGYKLVSCVSLNVEEKHYVFDFQDKFVLYHCFVKQDC